VRFIQEVKNMDTSETYIKMCEKAEEIQPCLDNPDGVGGTWVSAYILYHTAPMNQSHDKDGYYHVIDEIGRRRCEARGNEDDYIKSSRAIWLPRQDQLQEMIGGTWSGQLFKLDKWIAACPKYKHIESMEHLWLAFVMSERYGKVWSGVEWVKKT